MAAQFATATVAVVSYSKESIQLFGTWRVSSRSAQEDSIPVSVIPTITQFLRRSVILLHEKFPCDCSLFTFFLGCRLYRLDFQCLEKTSSCWSTGRSSFAEQRFRFLIIIIFIFTYNYGKLRT